MVVARQAGDRADGAARQSLRVVLGQDHAGHRAPSGPAPGDLQPCLARGRDGTGGFQPRTDQLVAVELQAADAGIEHTAGVAVAAADPELPGRPVLASQRHGRSAPIGEHTRRFRLRRRTGAAGRDDDLAEVGSLNGELDRAEPCPHRAPRGHDLGPVAARLPGVQVLPLSSDL